MFTINPGYAFADVSGLNRFLAPGTPGEFSEHFGLLGLQGTSECKRFMYGYTLQAGMSEKNTVSNYSSIPGNNMEYYARFGNLLFHGGYAIVSTERVKFYPLLGIGIGAMHGNFSRIDNLSGAQFANNPGVQGRVTKYMACFDGALSLDLLIPSKRWSEDGRYGRVLGIRVGYTQGVGVDDWKFAGARILDNSSYNPGIAYAKLEFGVFRHKYKTDVTKTY